MQLLLMLPAIIALGLVTSIEDIRLGKIRNRWIIAGFSYSLIGNLALGTIDRAYGLIIASSLIVSYALWYSDIWSAGDGKLFFAFSALLPADTYIRGYASLLPSSAILINTFIPLFIYLLFKQLSNVKMPTRKPSLGVVAALIAITWPLAIIASSLGSGWPIIIAISYLVIGKWLQSKLILIIAVLRIALDANIYRWNYWLSITLSAIIIWGIQAIMPHDKRSMRFAPFLFAGAIMTLLFGGDLVSFVTGLIS